MARYFGFFFIITALCVATTAAMATTPAYSSPHVPSVSSWRNQGSTKGRESRAAAAAAYYPLFSTVVKTYNANYAFEARDYELYINASGILPSTAAGSSRLRSSSLHDPIATDSLVSGPALAFIVVLALGACMF
ncbi:hypothetical protein O0I10_004245 [Lichtheimia ornata]|uniref:Uncharacterized protein n=1 Tax=Lichtheimia ornata TaxID=688661 RepID=A0AAD7V645_9FUNG|nr:uncharacterized protein O0I10_004245 [Lichtheimia ornata]KAJ8660018.1 hypothetical protein O0I10_004245 [Lichtheimia ornata]